MNKEMPVAAVLDTFGLLCPIPIIKTAAKVKQMNRGEILKVLSDDPGILEDIPAWCTTSGNELMLIEEHGDEYHVYIRKLR
jgi:tRNA 2-thiouridine synthesizing protein A